MNGLRVRRFGAAYGTTTTKHFVECGTGERVSVYRDAVNAPEIRQSGPRWAPYSGLERQSSAPGGSTACAANTLSPQTGLSIGGGSRRLLLALATGVAVLAIAGVAIAAGLGAFSGTTIGQERACDASTVALTTASGARVLTGHTDAGISCVAYEGTNGAGGGTAGRLGESSPSGILAGMTQGAIFGLVPAGYDTLTLGSVQIPIVNQAFVVDRKLVVGPGTLPGPAGQTTVNLSELAAG